MSASTPEASSTEIRVWPLEDSSLNAVMPARSPLSSASPTCAMNFSTDPSVVSA